MTGRIRALTTLIAPALLFVLLAGCAVELRPEPTAVNTPKPTPPPADTIDIGIVLPAKDEPRWLQDEAKFREMIGATPYTCEVLFSQKDSSVEEANVEALIEKGVKALIICPQDASWAASAAEKARAAGVKVISYDRLICGTGAVDYYVTFDSVDVGRVLGQYLVDQAGSAAGNPLYLYGGSSSDSNAFIFMRGWWEALQPKIADGAFVVMNSPEAEKLKDTPTLTNEQLALILGQISTSWDPTVARKLAEDNITANPPPAGKTVYLLAPNDGAARAIADAFAAAGNPYYITGQDAEKESVQYIIDGKQSMTVFKDTRILAKDAADLAVALMEGRTPQTNAAYNNMVKDVPAVCTRPVIVTKENVKETIFDSGYYTAGDFTGL